MRAGKLRYTVTLERIGTGKNSRGELSQSYSTIATRRAAIRPLIGREFYQASGEHSELTTEIRIRRDAITGTLKPKDRITDTGHSPNVIYDIQSVMRPNETAQELVIMCVRRSG